MSELTGGILNAMERKEPLESVRRSFLNAGYPPAEIDQAISEASQTLTPLPKPQIFNPLPVQKQITKTKTFKKIYILLAICSVLVLAGAALLGLYWDRLFA
jgi:hypothetical protein